MKPQDVQMIIKVSRKIVGYASISSQGDNNAYDPKTSFLDQKLGVICDDDKVEIWLRRTPEATPNEETRVFYATNLDGENYLVLVFHEGRWMKYLHQRLNEEEKKSYTPVDDADLFGDIAAEATEA